MCHKVLLAGCGITSIITGKLLQTQFENISITIWEKFNESGGRFNTIKGGKFSELSVDLGAQYITTTDDIMKEYNEIYSILFNKNLLKPMDHRIKGMKPLSNDKRNFSVPSGMKSIVDNLIEHIKLNNLCFGHNLVSLNREGNKWSALTDSGIVEVFDIVILTMPVPEILNLSGDVKLILSDYFDTFSNIKYSSRFALGLFFDCDVATDCDAEYIYGDPVIRFVGTDSWKSNSCSNNTFRSAVIHTTIQFGEKHYTDDMNIVKQIIIDTVKQHFKHWPKPSSVTILQWKYSQVLQPYDSKPGAVTLSEEPLLIAGGDGFIGSTFDQCLFSATRISEIIFKKYCKPSYSHDKT